MKQTLFESCTCPVIDAGIIRNLVPHAHGTFRSGQLLKKRPLIEDKFPEPLELQTSSIVMKRISLGPSTCSETDADITNWLHTHTAPSLICQPGTGGYTMTHARCQTGH